MKSAATHREVRKKAPRILGAFFCGWVLLFGIGCKKSTTPDWDSPGAAAPLETPASPALPSPSGPSAQTPDPAVTPANPAPTAQTAKSTGEGLRFISYNVENWLSMDRQSQKSAPKPAAEKQAVVTLLARYQPDVVGICEIGTAGDLADLQASLKMAGLDLPHTHFAGGSDPTRHLGLLSRFPITSTAKPTESQYQLGGQSFAINRGILDATVDARGKAYRFLGVHLKSKRDSEQGDQEAIRLSEARLVRRHLESILKQDPQTNLVVYGDFNDTRSTPALKMIYGSKSSPTGLIYLDLKDSHQEKWTHFWDYNDIYSRFDFIMVSQALRQNIDATASKIIDDAEWSQASDHRPVMAVFE